MAFKLADASEITEGQGIIVKGPQGDEIALFKWKGKIWALNNACPHQGGPLGDGELENGVVTCPWHGIQFDICTGVCIEGIEEDAQTLPIIEKEGVIYLEEAIDANNS